MESEYLELVAMRLEQHENLMPFEDMGGMDDASVIDKIHEIGKAIREMVETLRQSHDNDNHIVVIEARVKVQKSVAT
jgi:hypothetical protein